MSWTLALERAGQIAAADMAPALRRPDHWDYVAIRGLVAIVLAALAEQSATAPAAVPLRDVLRHLDQGSAHVRELAEVVVGAELACATDACAAAAAPDNSATDTWLWLTRTWPRPSEERLDIRAQYGGMTRGIGVGHTGPAIEAVTAWAARAVDRAAEQLA